MSKGIISGNAITAVKDAFCWVLMAIEVIRVNRKERPIADIRPVTKNHPIRKMGLPAITNNKVIPVTVIKCDPCHISQIKTNERDGYSAIQLAMGSKKEKNISGGEKGHLKAAGIESARKLVEIRVGDISEYELGQSISVEQFEAGETIDVSAISKGHGFAGGMKRHNFKGQGASHGNHKHHRAPGSIGACATPGRVV